MIYKLISLIRKYKLPHNNTTVNTNLQCSIKKYTQCAFIYFSFNITDKNKTYQDTIMMGQQYFEFWIENLYDNSNSAKKLLKTWSYYLLAYVTHLNYF